MRVRLFAGTDGDVEVVLAGRDTWKVNGRDRRGGTVRRNGSQGQVVIARTELPAALIGIVGRSGSGTLTVKRTLVGATSATLPALDIDGTGGRCSVFSDTISADTMTAGSFRYEVRVLRGGEQIVARDRAFVAAARAGHEASAVGIR